LPQLGCGNGGLDWEKVQPMIEHHLEDLPVEVLVYTPNDLIKEILQKESLKRKLS